MLSQSTRSFVAKGSPLSDSVISLRDSQASLSKSNIQDELKDSQTTLTETTTQDDVKDSQASLNKPKDPADVEDEEADAYADIEVSCPTFSSGELEAAVPELLWPAVMDDVLAWFRGYAEEGAAQDRMEKEAGGLHGEESSN